MTETMASELQEKVLQALRDPRWDYRTSPGIAAELSVSESDVAHAIADLNGQVRQAAVPDEQGRRLFTVSSRPVPVLERLAKLRNFLAKSDR